MKRIIARYCVKTLCSYFVLIFLVVAMLYPIYSISYTSSEKLIRAELNNEVQDSLNRLNQEIRSIGLYVEMLKSEASLVYLAYLPDENHIHLINSRLLLETLRKTLFSLSGLVDDVVILIDQSDYVINRSGVYKRAQYYGSAIDYAGINRGDYEYKLLYERMAVLPIQAVYSSYTAQTQPMVTLNYFSPTEVKAYYTFSFLIAEKTMSGFLLPEAISHYGSMRVTDRQGNILLDYHAGDTGERAHSMTIRSTDGEFTASIMLNEVVYAQSVASIRATIMGYILASLAAGAVYCIGMVYSVARPYRELTAFLETHFSPDDIRYSNTIQGCLKAATQGILLRSNEIHQQLQRLRSEYVASVLSNIAAGVNVEQHDLDLCARSNPIFDQPYVVVRMYLDASETPLSVQLLEQIAERSREELENFQATALVINGRRFIAVLPVGSSLNHMKNKLQEIAQKLQAFAGTQVKVCFVLSDMHQGMGECSDACQQCRYVRRNMSLLADDQESVACWSPSMLERKQSDAESINFGTFQADAFFNVLIGGNREQCDEFIRRFVQPQLACLSVKKAERVEAFYYVLVDVMETVARRRNVEYSAPIYDRDRPHEQTLALIRSEAASLCGMICVNKNTSQDKISITSYIRSHYMDNDLCLSKLADVYELSETYISRLIKSYTGKSYSEFVEDIRMERAAELLKNTNMLIADICRELGYENQNTFFKAFKRHYQVSPSVFRSNN